MSNEHAPTAREAAFLAVWASQRHEEYASDFLEAWRQKAKPSNQDFNLAQEIAYGTIRMTLALDHMAEQLTDKGKLTLKPKERCLMRCAIYQHVYMQRIPLYALVNETVELARKYCHSSFVGFLNATLRRLSELVPSLPGGDTPAAVSCRYSYPQFFVERLYHDFNPQDTEEILKAGNAPPKTMVRVRSGVDSLPSHLHPLFQHPPVALLADGSFLPSVAENPHYYIQNITPADLIETLCLTRDDTPPHRILDLCAAPGGKLLAIHDHFPQAALYANDISKNKIKLLEENIAKYGLNVQLTCFKGEEYPVSEPFDVVVLDVPCSNTGVLNKRPEARWRFSEDNLLKLEHLQKSLLEHAVDLIKPEGEIWYLTCSILKRENEEMMKWAEQHLNLRIKTEKVVLPSVRGWDGGYACALVHRSFSM